MLILTGPNHAWTSWGHLVVSSLFYIEYLSWDVRIEVNIKHFNFWPDYTYAIDYGMLDFYGKNDMTKMALSGLW